MTKTVIVDKTKKALQKFLADHPEASLLEAYLCYIEDTFNLHPVLFPKSKVIYENPDLAVDAQVKANQLWHETSIKIGYEEPSVNDQTRKIYICPFTGKVFGDNTHPNPQDAIYDWVAKCPENTERVGGLPVKRFYVSEDPEVIRNYIDKPVQGPTTKVVYSSLLSGKLFNSREGVIADFKKNYLKRMSLYEVQSQNRFQIGEGLLHVLQKHLDEDQIAAFVEAAAEQKELQPFVENWLK